MNIKDLNPNKKNPRKITGKKLDSLKKSLEKYGDLSGFVYNVRSKTLVSGHQRQKALEKGTIKIEVKHEKPTKAGTTSEGYVEINGERFKYREVDWDHRTETEALLAANKHGGDWDRDLLKLAVLDIPDLDFQLTGFELEELAGYGLEPIEKAEFSNIAYGQVPSPSIEEQKKIAETEQTDEQYVRDNPGPDSNLAKEEISAFEKVEETTTVPGKRIIIIIDCPTEEVKQGLRERLRQEVTQAGAKFF